MARVLIVGCGCRGRSLAAALVDEGHAVRATTRDPAGIASIEATGAEGVEADPDRLATVTACLEGVSALAWLMGSATGESGAVGALHGDRLAALLDHLVDTPVRGFVYEGAGSVPAELLAEGEQLVAERARTYRMPVAVTRRAPDNHDAWLGEMTAAVGRVLSG